MDSALNPAARLSEIGIRARRRVALRLLPFVFLLYVVNYIDRVNVSFANLRMSADLGFSDRVYGLGVGMFYITYVLFEIPGALMVERWSARKWIARIRFSCKRRNKFPCQLDFKTEIALATKLGWIKELDEDLDFTEKEQRLSGWGPIRYGASFVRTSSPVVKAQREKFMGD